MPQLIIDPNNRGDPVGQKSILQLERKTREYGFVPDLGCCKPGDLILSCSVSPDCIEKQIVATQHIAGFAKDDRRWTHAAVYLYEDFVVEAVPWVGVRSRSLYWDVPGSFFRVRRRPGLTDEQRFQIALCAQRKLGLRYNLKAALSLGLRAGLGGPWDRYSTQRRKRAAICSQVFYDALADISRHFLVGCPIDDPVMPAHLSGTTDLDDIFVEWLELT